MNVLGERESAELEIIGSRDYTPVSELASRFDVSDRTIRNDIASINQSSQTIGAEVHLKRKHGYFLLVTDEELFSKTSQGFMAEGTSLPALESKGQRQQQMLQLLLFSEGPVSYKQLASVACISEETVKTYLAPARQSLEEFDIKWLTQRGVGIIAYGSERSRRDCFLKYGINRKRLSYVTTFDTLERQLCSAVGLEDIRSLVRRTLAATHITTNDRGLKELVLAVGLAATRIAGRHLVERADSQHDIPSAIVATQQICAWLEKAIGLPIDRAEQSYLYGKLIENTNTNDCRVDADLLRRSIDAMLTDMYTNYGIDLRTDETLKGNLFKHLSLIFANGPRLNMTNPLLGTIKKEYPLPYDMTLAATSKVFNAGPLKLNENDVGYIALHIGSAIDRSRYAQRKPCRLLLVCSESRSVRQMFSTRISTLFRSDVEVSACVSFQEFMGFDPAQLDADLILSTVPLESEDLCEPYLLVRWNLPTADVQAISRFIVQSHHGNGVIDLVFSKQTFVRIHGSTERDNVIKKLCDSLVLTGAADKKIYDSVIERESLSETALTDMLAIPHPMVPCTQKTQVAVALLDKPCAWSPNHNQIRIVLLLAIKPSTGKNIEEFYDLITQIASSDSLQKELLQAQSFDDFAKILQDAYVPNWS